MSPLRFGIMINEDTVPRWCAVMLHSLLASEIAELSVVIVNGRYRRTTLARKVVRLRPRKMLYHAYRDIFFRPSANRPYHFGNELIGVPRVILRYSMDGPHSQVFTDDDVGRVRELELDFILRFGFNIVRGSFLDCARFGVWSTHFDDERRFRGGPPGFWEIFYGETITGAILQRLTHRLDGGVVLRRNSFPTSLDSYATNYDQIAYGCAMWPVEVCRDIVEGNAGYVDSEPSATRAPIYRNPHNRDMLKFIVTIIRRRCRGIER